MVNYHRMEWQYRANRIANWVMWGCVFALAPEVVFAAKHHFPWYEDVIGIVTLIFVTVAKWVEAWTRQYSDIF